MIRNPILISLLIFVVILQSCVQKAANNKPDNVQTVFDGIYFRLNDMEDQIIIILRHQILTLQNDVLERTSLNFQNELTDDMWEQQIPTNQRQNDNDIHIGNQTLFNNINSRLNSLEGHILYLRRQIINLQSEVTEIERNTNPQGGFNSFDTESREQGQEKNIDIFVNRIKQILIVLIILFVLVVAFFLYLKYKQQYTPTKKEIFTEKDITSSGKEDIKQPYNRLIENSSIALQSDVKKNDYPNTISYRKPNEISIINKVSLDDDISLLFNSSEKREKRYNSDTDDVFLDVSTSIIERMTMGEKISIILEKRGSPRTAMFVLVKDKLYLNFYNYNETNALIKEKEKIILMTYYINEGCLPGYIKICDAATVTQRGGRYTIETRGNLELYPL